MRSWRASCHSCLHQGLDTSNPSSVRLQVHKAKLLAPQRWQGAPSDGVVAVKVQYPDALQMMLQDLSNIRVAARFLQAGLCPRT